MSAEQSDIKPDSKIYNSPPIIKGRVLMAALESVRYAPLNEPIGSPGFDAAMRLLAIQNYGTDLTYPFGADRCLNYELSAQDNPFLPTIGVELEVPKVPKVRQDPGTIASLGDLGIETSNEESYFEFSLPPSYSWRTQALMLHTLLNLQLIPFIGREDRINDPKRQVLSPDRFSLHVNLGLPPGLTHRLAFSNSEERKLISEESQVLAWACGIAFCTPGRIRRKKTYWHDISKETEYTLKNKRQGHYGRLELKTQGFGDLTGYRQLAAIQELGTAFFSYCQQLPNTKIGEFSTGTREEYPRTDLANVWFQGKEDLWDVFDAKYKIDLKHMKWIHLAEFMRKTELQKDTNDVIRRMQRKIKALGVRV